MEDTQTLKEYAKLVELIALSAHLSQNAKNVHQQPFYTKETVYLAAPQELSTF
jgi:hypothetical protein